MVNCPAPFTGAVGFPVRSVSFAIIFTVPFAPSSANGVPLRSSSVATGGYWYNPKELSQSELFTPTNAIGYATGVDVCE